MENDPVKAILDALSLTELKDVLLEQGMDFFSSRYEHPFLLLTRLPTDEFENDIMSPRTVSSRLHESASDTDDPSLRYLVPLLKTNRNVYTTKITIGRARNNDVIIRAPKVSKLHAMIMEISHSKKYELIDTSSVNGTFLNGDLLSPNKAMGLADGDRIGIWRYEFEFYLPERLMKAMNNSQLDQS